MRVSIILLLVVGCTGAFASEFRIHNYSGLVCTNLAVGFEFPPGNTVVPMDGTSMSYLAGITADGSHSLDVYVDASGVTSIVVAEKDLYSYCWEGFLAGLGLGAVVFTYRLITMVGRSSPEL